jgi:hypothetical protein
LKFGENVEFFNPFQLFPSTIPYGEPLPLLLLLQLELFDVKHMELASTRRMKKNKKERRKTKQIERKDERKGPS